MYDLLVIGGGINGVGVARDAAGRGLKVCLVEKDDLASHTSSSSTKLIHGGLRYLEHYEFMLVRKSLEEREVLLRAAPHIIWPMRFVLPHDKEQRPVWLIRLGLFLYDHIGGRKILPPAKLLRRKNSSSFNALEDRFHVGFEYSDCWVEDSRLVVLNAMDAKERGAEILTRTQCTAIIQKGAHWEATVKSGAASETTIKAKAIVNAAGPWVDDIINKVHPGRNETNLRLVKGSHIITKRAFEGDHSYIFQNKDGRIIFAIPYEYDYTLIGTTDAPYDFADGDVRISEEETAYLCEAASYYFENDISVEDVVWDYAGVRPLFDDNETNASKVTRDYVLEYENEEGQAPILSIFGGKITTFRVLAEQVLEKMKSELPDIGKEWTEKGHLPGGDILDADFEAFVEEKNAQYSWYPKEELYRLLRAYGTRVDLLLDGVTSISGLGEKFDTGVYEAEIAYLIAHEFVTAADDVLWRRSKLGLHMSSEGIGKLAAWFGANAP